GHPRRVVSSGSASAWTRCCGRRPRDPAVACVSRRRPRLPLPLHTGRALPRRLQVPPVLFAVRDRRAAPVRARARNRPRRLAVAALQSVEPRRGRLCRAAEGLSMILGSPLTPLENVLRSIL